MTRHGAHRTCSSLRYLGAGLLLTAAAAGQAASQEAVRSEDLDGGRRLALSLPAPVVDLLSVPAAGGGHDLLLLVGGSEEAESSFRILRFGLGTAASLTPVATPTPEKLRSLIAIGRQNGEPRLGALSKGALWTVPRSRSDPLERALLFSTSQPVLPRQGLGSSELPSVLALARVGVLELYSTSPSGELSPPAAHALPVRASRKISALRLESPGVTVLKRAGGQPPIFAVGPQAEGSRRLKTLLLDPSAPPEEQRIEAWSLLPEAEDVASSWYAWVDGRPILLVATFSADKLGIFEKQKLRVFSLRSDRTRKGSPPSLARLTASRRWQVLDPVLADADGDGRHDLVLLQPEGLSGEKLVYEVHSSLSLGRFQQTSRKAVLPVAGNLWSYGSDIDGDGVADLAAVDDGFLLIFLGDSQTGRRPPISRKPRWKFPLGSPPKGTVVVKLGAGGDAESQTALKFPSILRLVDLDGDSRAEVVLYRQAAEGSGEVEIYLPD